MSDICLIYSKDDRSIADSLYNLLSKQWSVWWDDLIVGRYAPAIESEIPKAGCVVAIFSESFRNKDACTAELRIAQRSNIELLPIRIDNSHPPYPFDSYSITDMRGWSGESDHPGLLQLLRHIASIVPPRAKPARPHAIAGNKLLLPSLFFSVSSYDTQLLPESAVRALKIFGAPAILVSAYDLVERRTPAAIIRDLEQYRRKGGFVLIDSGNYEATRLSDGSWKQDDLKEALSKTPHDWAFCFDEMNKCRTPESYIKRLIRSIRRDQTFTKAPILPIVHAKKLRNGGYQFDELPEIVREISYRLHPQLIAIPERELGAGLVARAKTMRTIREELNKLPYYQPIHLLGTGNPWSIAILAAAGADTFDGLEWCRFVVDNDNDRLHHFQHLEFFSDQTPFSRAIMDDGKIEFAGKVALHNLEYFTDFINMMRSAVTDNGLGEFISGLIGRRAASILKGNIPELYK